MVYTARVIIWKRIDYCLQLAAVLLPMLHQYFFNYDNAIFKFAISGFSLATIQTTSAILHRIYQNQLLLSKKRKLYEFAAGSCLLLFLLFSSLSAFDVLNNNVEPLIILGFILFLLGTLLAIMYFFMCNMELIKMLEINDESRKNAS